MANFDFQGEYNLLSEKQIKFITDVLEKHDFEGSNVLIETLGKAGDNYASCVKSIIAEREDGKKLKMVAKIAPTSEFLRAAVSVEITFGNEFVIYDQILPKFQQLDLKAGIPEENRFRFPFCFGTLDENLNEIILLEDLRESGYIMLDRFTPLTDKEVRVIFNSFAKIHSFSFVLRQKDPKTYEELTSKLKDFFISPYMEHNVKNNFVLIEENVLKMFDSNKYIDKIRGALSYITDEAHKLRRFDTGSKYSVITHGDSWINNMMFKLNDTDGTPEKCVLIDFQLSSEKSPASDLLYLIFSCTDYDTRSKYYDSWIDEYHEKLDDYLSEHGTKAAYVYSKEKLLADLKRYAKFFLGWSILLSNVLCMNTEDAEKLRTAMDSTASPEEIMETLNADNVDIKTQAAMKTRVQGIIDSYYDLGYCS